MHEELDYLFLEGSLADELPLLVDVVVIFTEQDLLALRERDRDKGRGSDREGIRC